MSSLTAQDFLPDAATPTNRQKLLNEAFGGLSALTGTASLRARRAAEKSVQRAREQKLSGMDYAGRVTGRVIGEALAAALGSGQDTELDRAKLVDEAIAAAQKETGFNVNPNQAAQIEAEVREQAGSDAQQAALQKTGQTQTTDAFETQHSLISNTINELVQRGLTTEAAALLPNLKALEEAQAEELMRQAELEGKVLSNVDALDGDTKTIVPDSLGRPIAAQIMADGTARYWDDEKQAEVVIRPGQYFVGQVTGSPSDLEDKEMKSAIPVMRGMIDSMAMMTDLRAEIRMNPEALTVAGDALAWVNKFVPDLRQLQRQRWMSEPDLLADNMAEFDKAISDLGITNARQRVAVEKLAFALASARENGKLSVSDVEMAARAFGQGERDPRVRMALIDDVAKDLKVRYETFGVLGDGKLTSTGIYQRAGTFFDAYDKEASRVPLKPIGDPAPRDETAENNPNILFRTDSGVTIE